MDGVAGVRAGSVVRMLFDYLVASGILAHNPVLSVRAPRQSVTKDKTLRSRPRKPGSCCAQSRPINWPAYAAVRCWG